MFKAVFYKNLENIGEGLKNFSLLPIENGYYGLFRKYIFPNPTGIYPELGTENYLCKLDENFTLQTKTLMKDISNRTIYRNYTTGIEDARFINHNYMSATTLDSNDKWQSEISLIKVDLENNNFLSVTPLRLPNSFCRGEKNWVFIKQIDNKMIFLYDTNPLNLVQSDMSTGNTQIIKQEYIPVLQNMILHNGSLIQLDNGNYLVNVRKMLNRNGGTAYDYSLFLLFDENFNFLKMSKPFYFKETIGLKWDGNYEYCPCMFIKNNDLYCCVTENEQKLIIYKYNLESIF